MTPTEHQIQSAVFDWRAKIVGQYPLLRWLHSIPNGMRATPEVGKWMVAEGLTRDVPDICLPVPVKRGWGHYCGLWIEVKTETGRVRTGQREWIDYLRKAGYRAEICRGVDAVIAEICEYLGIERGY